MAENDNVAFDKHEVVKQILIDTTNAFKTKEANPNKFAYCRAVQKDVTKVYNTLKVLQLVRVLIAEEHPMVDKRKGSNIQRNQFLRYNLENYFLRMTTCRDQLLQLIDTLLQFETKRVIGFDKRLIKEADKKNISDVKLAVENINKLFSSVQHIRNKIAHEGGYDDIDLQMLELAEIAKEQFNIETFTEEEYNAYWAMTIMSNIKEMMQIEHDLTSNLYMILKAFYSIYLAKIADLDNHLKVS
jgi:hypothetical protein